MKDHSIAFGWYGLPQYAARCIRRTRDDLKVRIPVIGTKPSVPIKGMEEVLGGDVTWIEGNSRPTWAELGLPVPRLFIVTGWAYPMYDVLSEEVRRGGGVVVTMVDNCWKGSLRQWVGAVYFRLFIRQRFKAAFVPGCSARRLLRFFGVSGSRIFSGLYGADSSIFKDGGDLNDRPKKIVFIGQYIERKGVASLVDAFKAFSETHPDWTLELYGSGPLKASFGAHPRITVNDFAQPDRLGPLLREARALVLPSFEEHWGLVVHEAALSGCMLLLSDKIGSLPDLGGPENSLVFKPGDRAGIATAFTRLASLDAAAWARGREESLERASRFGPAAFSTGVKAIHQTLFPENP